MPPTCSHWIGCLISADPRRSEIRHLTQLARFAQTAIAANASRRPMAAPMDSKRNQFQLLILQTSRPGQLWRRIAKKPTIPMINPSNNSPKPFDAGISFTR
jgi:hypothetical protein